MTLSKPVKLTPFVPYVDPKQKTENVKKDSGFQSASTGNRPTVSEQPFSKPKINIGGWDYSVRLKLAARKLFMQGNGYKKTAGVIGISEYTVRDWNRKWKAGEFLKGVEDPEISIRELLGI